MFDLKCKNPEPTIRAYSMANYPAEGDVFMLTVRIATPPFKPDRSGFMDVNPGIASSYIFSLKPGDKVIMSGPYGDFHPHFDTKKEMIWVGGGAGMAPLRAQIMHMTKTLHTKDREMHYFYGARALNEVFYLDDFLGLEKEYPNFHFHLALDRPDPAADAAGVKYTPGFVHQVMLNTYLKDHEAPEDIEYYMCGPGPMSKKIRLQIMQSDFLLFINISLLDEVDGALEEAVEGLTFKHTVLKECQVDELVDDGVVLRVVGDDGLLLVFLLLHGFLCFSLLILVFLRQFVVLLLILGCADSCQASFLTFEFALNGLQGLGGLSLAVAEHLLDERMVGIEHDVEGVGHLAIEVHARLEAAHLLHTTHILVLCDNDWTGLFAEGIYLYHELGLVELR